MDDGTSYPRKAAIAFVACALAVMLIPFAGMLWSRTDGTTENRELAPVPSFTNEDGSPNVNLLADAGTYFEDHFAYRNNLVDANAHMRAALGASATDQVIVGSDGWLYYAGTLSDYVGASALSERALANIAHNLAQLQGYAKAHGAAFVFAVAPNKNTLYGEGMPAHYLRSPEPSNYERLLPYLEKYGVNTVDLLAVLHEKAQAGERLYCYRDTHWTNEGALVGADALLSALNAPAIDAAADRWIVRDDLTGDVAGMLYPAFPGTESEAYVGGINDGPGLSGSSWSYVEGADVTDNQIVTQAASEGASGGGPHSLMMYRDSFGNALIPYLSSVFPQATYSKLVPYSAEAIDVAGADAVIVERAERHLPNLAEMAFIMPAPRVRLDSRVLSTSDVGAAGDSDASFVARADGGSVVFEGRLGEAAVADADVAARILLAVDDGVSEPVVYEASSLSVTDESTGELSDWGYSAHIPRGVFGEADSLAAVIVLLADGEDMRPVARFTDVALP